jgi:DNA-damage-inducible protein J
LKQLGSSPSSAIQILYSQIVLTQGMPPGLCLPAKKSAAIRSMIRQEIDAEFMKGIESLKTGKLIPLMTLTRNSAGNSAYE